MTKSCVFERWCVTKSYVEELCVCVCVLVHARVLSKRVVCAKVACSKVVYEKSGH